MWLLLSSSGLATALDAPINPDVHALAPYGRNRFEDSFAKEKRTRLRKIVVAQRGT